jgi:uncharacterized membrane protein YfcA
VTHCLPTWRCASYGSQSLCLGGRTLDGVLSVAAIFGIFLLAGFVKGVVGLGLPTVAIGLLGLTMAPAQAAALLVAPSLVTNVWQSAAGPILRPLLSRLWPMLAGICVGTWASAGIITGNDSTIASAALGAVLAVYAAIGLSKIHFSIPRSAEAWLAPLIGLATGAVTGATGVFTFPAVPYLQAIGVEKDDLVQALGLSFAVSTIALAGVLIGGGAFHLAEMGFSIVSLIGALAGMGLGQRVRGRVHPDRFRLLFFIGLLLLGVHLALRGFY